MSNLTTINGNNIKMGTTGVKIPLIKLKENTTYTLMINVLTAVTDGTLTICNEDGSRLYVVNNNASINATSNGRKYITFTTRSDLSAVEKTSSGKYLLMIKGTDGLVIDKRINVIEGNQTAKELPYFEGMKSTETIKVTTYNSPVQFGKGGRL